MDKFIVALKKNAKLLLLIFVGAYALFELLYAIGRMSAGDGGVVAGGIFFLIAFCGLVAALFVALIKKNEQAAKFVGLAFFGYLAIRMIYGLLSWAGDSAIEKAMFSFDFLASLAGIAIFAMIVLGLFLPKLKDNKVIPLVSLCLLLAFVFFTLLARLLEFGYYGEVVHEYHDWGINNYHYPWYIIIGNIGEILLLGAILFGYLLLFVKTPEIEEPKENTAEETVQSDELEAEVVEEAETSESAVEAVQEPEQTEVEEQNGVEEPEAQAVEEPAVEAEVEGQPVEE